MAYLAFKRVRAFVFNNKVFFFFLILSLLIGIGIGNFSEDYLDFGEKQYSERHQDGFKFISPLLECNNSEELGEREFSSLETDINNLITQKVKQGELTHASIYFRDLNNGPWFGINEKEVFTPASLLKLPIAMSYFKLAESDPNMLKEKIKYEKELSTLPQDFKPKQSIKPGETYTVEELITRMIEYSDNEALSLLVKNKTVTPFDKLITDLDITVANELTPNDYMNVKEYSSLFRVLFNASYLNKQMSEKVLELLSKVDFRQGIVGPIPNKIIVSHKFGERELDNDIKQLHDCGIIYYPNRPYLLCVMTRGKNLDQLSNFIRLVSGLVYSEMDKRYNK